MNITVTRNFLRFKENGNDAFEGTRTEYYFAVFERGTRFDMMLTGMTVWGRQTPRHKWKVEKVIYDKYERRRQADTSAGEPTVGAEIINEALDKVRMSIQFTTWKERNP